MQYQKEEFNLAVENYAMHYVEGHFDIKSMSVCEYANEVAKTGEELAKLYTEEAR